MGEANIKKLQSTQILFQLVSIKRVSSVNFGIQYKLLR